MIVYALHGFLGLPTDWQGVLPDCVSIDLYQEGLASPEEGLMAWAKSFNKLAAEDPRPKMLVGYSLGGRLALHALLADSSIWEGAVIVSANPGGLSQERQAARLLVDDAWAERFAIEPWDRLMNAWDSQGAFAGSFPIPRNESDYDRSLLAATLRGWSLGLQADLRQGIASLNIPLLWIVGEHDSAAVATAESISLAHRQSKKIVVPNAGHRLPWDNFKGFNSELSAFTRLNDF